MPAFSKKSYDRLMTCDKRLQTLFLAVVKEYDCMVLCGHRSEEDQNKAVAGGFSKTQFPKSKHNSLPSKAVDVAPYPLDWNNKQAFIDLAKFVLKKADELGIKIKWGGDFKKFFDGPHYELVE